MTTKGSGTALKRAYLEFFESVKGKAWFYAKDVFIKPALLRKFWGVGLLIRKHPDDTKRGLRVWVYKLA